MEVLDFPDIYFIKNKFIIADESNAISITNSKAFEKYKNRCFDCNTITNIVHCFTLSQNNQVEKEYLCPKCSIKKYYEKVICTCCVNSKIGCFCCGSVQSKLRKIKKDDKLLYLCDNLDCLKTFGCINVNYHICVCYIKNFKKLYLHNDLKSVIQKYLFHNDCELSIDRKCIKCTYTNVTEIKLNKADNVMCKC